MEKKMETIIMGLYGDYRITLVLRAEGLGLRA